MKSDIKSINSVCKEAVVTVPQAVVQEEESSVLSTFAQQVKVPGFRKGKVPLSLIRSRYTKELGEQVDKTIAQKIFDDLVKEQSWDVFSLSKFTSKKLENGDREFTFTVDLKPTFELIDYKNIEIENPNVEVTDKEVDKAVEEIRNHHAEYNIVKRPAKKGDFVRLQYRGTFEDGTPIAEKVKVAPIWAAQDNTWEEAGNTESPGVKAIIEGIIGMSIDEEKDVDMTYPEDFEVEDLRGKKALYHVKVFEVREKILPELSDEFFKKIHEEDLKAFRQHVKENLKQRKIQTQRFEQRETVVRALIDQMNFEVPESSASYEQVHIVRGFIERQINEGVSIDEINANKDQLFEDTKELSHDRAKINFILEKIAELEKITLTNQELMQMVTQEAAMLRLSPDRFLNEIRNDRERIHDLQRRALFGKTLDFILVENLKRFPNFTDPDAPKTEEVTKFEEGSKEKTEAKPKKEKSETKSKKAKTSEDKEESKTAKAPRKSSKRSSVTEETK
ncbi:MAG: trigger factor [Verrucomicrobiota bacterium]|nr:MAG: trigger factor [Verrucomicrobiota bacterium]